VVLKPPDIEAASSAARDDRTDVNIWADDVEAASLAATSAATDAAVFLRLSSTFPAASTKDVTGGIGTAKTARSLSGTD
jgi:hypothetical protein